MGALRREAAPAVCPTLRSAVIAANDDDRRHLHGPRLRGRLRRLADAERRHPHQRRTEHELERVSGRGAIYSAGALTVVNDVFASNAASNAAGGFGGAIYENGTVSPDGLTIRGTTFVSNRAAFRGGAVADDGTGVLTVIGDALRDQHAYRQQWRSAGRGVL